MKEFTLKKISCFVMFTLSTTTTAFSISAQESQAENDTEIISVIGRSAVPRTVTESPVPVDVFTEEEFNAVGNTGDVTDNLKALIPSYTATPATGDGSAFVRPTSLRGMSPDQTLVLINGKRRHRSALVQFFAPAAGNGSHGPDVGMIPSIAVKSVEVLRDGAAAQYGSDAIAGVINFNMKDSDEGGSASVQYGQHFEGEESVKVAFNKGLPLGDSGFVNLSFEHTDNEVLSRGVQRPDVQQAINANQDGADRIGEDSPFGDSPLAQTWGRPETSGSRFFVNMGYDFSEDTKWYLQSNYAKTDGRYRFFFRPPALNGSKPHGTLATLMTDDNYNKTNPHKIFSTGYTPFLDGAQEDVSITTGIKGYLSNDGSYNLSVSYGHNSLDYFLNNTINAKLGLDKQGAPTQMDFDVGAFEQEEIGINADFTLPLSDTLNFAYGLEWREETYTIIAGEPDSYKGEGTSGLVGAKKKDAGAFSRDNIAVYTELEQDVTDDFLVQYALRYEDYSDFGGTTNGKIAGRYLVSDSLTVRGGFSTGFHAPTPGQANVRTTTTTFGSNGAQEDTVLVPATTDLAVAYGGSALTEEKSTSTTLGFSSELSDNTNLTVDFYDTAVDDRIYRTAKIDVSKDPVAQAMGIKKLSFYTNALDMEHTGYDVVLTTKFSDTNVSFAYNYNRARVVGQSKVSTLDDNGNKVQGNVVSDSIVEDIENNYPNSRFVLSTKSQLTDDLSLMARATYYGEHYDERGTINGSVLKDDNGDPFKDDDGNVGYRETSKLIKPTMYVDMELTYTVTDDLSLHFGAANIFDQYVDKVDAPYANRNSVGLPYPRRSAANYEGGSWYLKTQFTF